MYAKGSFKRNKFLWLESECCIIFWLVVYFSGRYCSQSDSLEQIRTWRNWQYIDVYICKRVFISFMNLRQWGLHRDVIKPSTIEPEN